MAIERFRVSTHERNQFVDITAMLREAIARADLGEAGEGEAVIYCPHTTAGIAINENADPGVCHDVLRALDEAVPWRAAYYQHIEDNSAAHVKACMVGSSARVLIESGRPVLGRWQAVFFCEFDGPRERDVLIRVSP